MCMTSVVIILMTKIIKLMGLDKATGLAIYITQNLRSRDLQLSLVYATDQMILKLSLFSFLNLTIMMI